jgi:hypothetical protein
VQHAANQRRENRLEMRDLQAPANPSNARPITRKEERSAVRVRSSALRFPCKIHKNKKPLTRTSGALSAVDCYPKASSMPSAACLPMLGIQREYRSRIIVVEACPRRCWTSFGWTPRREVVSEEVKKSAMVRVLLIG